MTDDQKLHNETEGGNAKGKESSNINGLRIFLYILTFFAGLLFANLVL